MCIRDSLYGLLEVRPHIMLMNYNDFNGFKETGFDHYDIHWEFKNGYRIDTGMNVTTQGVKSAFDIVDDVTIQPGTYDHKEAQIVFHTDKSAPLSFSIRNYIGGRFGGDRKSIEPVVTYRYGENFTSEFSVIALSSPVSKIPIISPASRALGLPSSENAGKVRNIRSKNEYKNCIH